MTDKLLAEWFWTDRWMGSSAFLLPMEARGLYREMLTQAWRRGGRLPKDPEALQRAVGATKEEWDRAWPRVSRYWRPEGDTLVNDTQLEILGLARAAATRASEHGRKGAQARHGHSSGCAPAQPEDKPPSPSPSPLNGTPLPPASGGWFSALEYAAQVGKPAITREAQRTLNRWVRGKLSIEEIRRKIDNGDHLPRLPL